MHCQLSAHLARHDRITRPRAHKDGVHRRHLQALCRHHAAHLRYQGRQAHLHTPNRLRRRVDQVLRQTMASGKPNISGADRRALCSSSRAQGRWADSNCLPSGLVLACNRLGSTSGTRTASSEPSISRFTGRPVAQGSLHAAMTRKSPQLCRTHHLESTHGAAAWTCRPCWAP